MKLSTNPAVWRTAVGSIVAALIAAGVLGPELGDTVNAVAGALLIAVTAILPVVGAIISKSRTVPVVAGTPAVRTLVRNSNGEYEGVPSNLTAARRVDSTESLDGGL